MMERDDLKKLLAGLSIAGLLAGATLTTGCSTTGESS
jgi:radical SAM modification target selenobiotic family peptide